MYLNGGQIIFNKLIQHKTRNVFMYSGGAIMNLIDCFYNNCKYYMCFIGIKNKMQIN